MSENFMIIKTKKLSPREVKKKLRDFIDSISEDCGPEVEKMAEELKAHGDNFVDALCEGGAANYRNDGYAPSNRSGMGRVYHRDGQPMYRNEGTWEEREELRKKNEQKLQEIDRMMQELRHNL